MFAWSDCLVLLTSLFLPVGKEEYFGVLWSLLVPFYRRMSMNNRCRALSLNERGFGLSSSEVDQLLSENYIHWTVPSIVRVDHIDRMFMVFKVVISWYFMLVSNSLPPQGVLVCLLQTSAEIRFFILHDASSHEMCQSCCLHCFTDLMYCSFEFCRFRNLPMVTAFCGKWDFHPAALLKLCLCMTMIRTRH